MIVLVEAFGNHSNRLFQNLHFEAFCMEHSLDFANATFEDMQHLYYAPPPAKSLSDLELLLLTKVKAKLNKLKIPTNVYSFDKEDENNAGLLLKKSKNTCYVKGWGFRVHDLTAKYQDVFIKKYSLKTDFYRDHEFVKTIDGINREDYTITGVHVRRGDYKTFMGGKYLFSDDIYRLYMDNLSAQLSKHHGKKNIFILFSNEDITIEQSNSVLQSRNEWYIDQYLMSKCDYLIGPPSTFTLWASYIGKTKYFHITDNSGKISLEDFSYSIG